MTWWMRLNHFLNSRRLTYAWITGIVLWAAWLLSTSLGQGNMDLAGQVIGTDYLQFYAAGVTLREGQSAELYNFQYQSQLEQTIAGPELKSFHAFVTPPFLAWLYVPLTYLPYNWSFVAWCLFGFLCLGLSLKLLASSKPRSTFLWSLTWFPIFAAISFGQNSLLSLLLFSLTFWFWRKEKFLAAGLVSSLLLFKPQLVLGLGLLWLLDFRKSWKSLLGIGIGGSFLAGLCFWLLPDASQAYIDLARNFLPGMLYQEQFPLLHLHSFRGFWLLLFPGKVWLVEALSLLFSLLGVIAFIIIWRMNRFSRKILFALTVCLTIWITPHAMIYDWSILLIPALVFWQEFPTQHPFYKAIFALIWLAAFLSGPLTLLQLKISPIALQISIPVWFYVMLTIYKKLISDVGKNGDLEMA